MPIMTGGLDCGTCRTNHPGGAIMQLGAPVINCHCPGILLRRIHALYPAYVCLYALYL